jgi:hypothetical protein
MAKLWAAREQYSSKELWKVLGVPYMSKSETPFWYELRWSNLLTWSENAAATEQTIKFGCGDEVAEKRLDVVDAFARLRLVIGESGMTKVMGMMVGCSMTQIWKSSFAFV